MAHQALVSSKAGQKQSRRILAPFFNVGNILNTCKKSVQKLLLGTGTGPLRAHQKTSSRVFLEENLGDWNLDVFAFADMANGKPLLELVTLVFQKRAIPTAFKIPERTLNNFLSCLEDQYDDKVAYHNSSHAADVFHCVHVLLNSPALEGTFTELEIFAALFSAAVHDVGHPGWSNGFFAEMCKCCDLTVPSCAFAKTDDSEGGNRSYLEERHLLMAFQILDISNCNILCGLDALQLAYFKGLVTDMVLATDMAKHADLMTRVQHLVHKRKDGGTPHRLRLESNDDKLTVLQFLLHSADLSNPTKCFKTYKRSVDCLFKELFELGDQEKILGFAVSPNCDRHNTNLPKTQVNFINFVAEPLWKLWHELVMDEGSQAILKSVKSNLNKWQLNKKEDDN